MGVKAKINRLINRSHTLCWAGSIKELFTSTPKFKRKWGVNARYPPLNTMYTMPPACHERVVKIFMPYGIKFRSLMVTYMYDLDRPVISVPQRSSCHVFVFA